MGIERKIKHSTGNILRETKTSIGNIVRQPKTSTMRERGAPRKPHIVTDVVLRAQRDNVAASYRITPAEIDQFAVRFIAHGEAVPRLTLTFAELLKSVDPQSRIVILRPRDVEQYFSGSRIDVDSKTVTLDLAE